MLVGLVKIPAVAFFFFKEKSTPSAVR